MRFTIPQFIEYEARIVGPFTFRQFIFVGIAGAICFVLYFSLGKTNFLLFLLLTTILMLGALALAFVKISGRGLPTILANFLRFSFAPKIYIWRKKETPLTIFKRSAESSPIKATEEEEELPLKIAEKSQLKKLRTEIETKTK